MAGTAVVAAADAGGTDGTDVSIDAGLEDDGTTTVVVRFQGQSADAIRPLSEDQRLESLRTHAADAQAPLEEFAARTPGVEIDRQFWIANAVAVTVDTDRVGLERLAAVDGVTALHENHEIEPHGAAATGGSAADAGPTPAITSAASDPSTTAGLEEIDVPTAWSTFDTRGEGVRVAVLDTGIDPDHEDVAFDADNWAEFDANGDRVSSDPHDHDGHGTHVSGTIAGGSASGTAIGVAPDAELLHGKVLGDGSSTFTAVAAGMEWAVENDADVLSLSLGGGSRVDSMVEPVRNAQQAGTIVVTSVGNDGAGTSTSPGDVYDAFAIGASDGTGIAAFSSSETVVADEWSDPPAEWPDEYRVPDVVAPGVDVLSAYPGNRYAELDGTSMAAPHVSGAIALLYANAAGDLSPAETRDLFASTAEDLGADATRQGAGRINVTAALLEQSRDALDPTIGPETANVSTPTTLTVDADHPIAEYRWTFEDGRTATTTDPSIEHTFDELGPSEVTVTLEDVEGYETTVSSTVTVDDRLPPTPDLAANRTDGVEVGLETVTLDASGSTDNDAIDRYEWTFGDDVVTTTQPTLEHAFADTGTATVGVTVVDASGNENGTTLDVEVVDTTSPTAALEAPAEAVAFTDTSFDAGESTDNGAIDRYEWTFGDGITATTDDRVATHSYDATGTRTVTTTVVDDAGNSGETTADLTVVDPPTVTIDSPVEDAAVADGAVDVDYVLEHTDLEGAAGVEYRVTDDGGDPVGDWTSAAFESTRDEASFSLTTTDLADGTYAIDLRLVDDAGEPLPFDSATDEVTVTVDASPPAVTLGVSPADDAYGSIGEFNPAVVDLSVADPHHESATIAVLAPDGQGIREWDRSGETGDGGATSLEWDATDDDGRAADSGEYEVVVTATDALGNDARETMAVAVDTATPSLAFESIEGGTVADATAYANDTDTLSVPIRADDGLGDPDRVESLAVTLDAVGTNYRQSVPVERGAGDDWTATVDGESLPDEGTYDVVATVTDAANNTIESTADERIRLDRTEPRLSTTVTDLEDETGTATVRVRSTEPLVEVPTVTVTDPSGEETTVADLTSGSETTWTGTIDATETGQYDLTATGEDRAGNRGSDDTGTTIETVSTTNRTVTVYDERTGTFLEFNTTADVEETFVTISETESAPYPLARGSAGVDFLTTKLAAELETTLSNATIAVPVDEGRLPEGVAPDSSAVGLRWYNETASEWEDRPLETTEIDTERDGRVIEGTYWTATVDHFSTYGVVVEDETPPELASVDPADGETLDSSTTQRTIELEYDDDVSGVDTSSIVLSIDGQDVTDDDATRTTATRTTHEGFDVSAGDSYSIVLEIADEAGNGAVYETSFEVAAADDGSDDGSGDGSDADDDDGEAGGGTAGGGGSSSGGGGTGGGSVDDGGDDDGDDEMEPEDPEEADDAEADESAKTGGDPEADPTSEDDAGGDDASETDDGSLTNDENDAGAGDDSSAEPDAEDEPEDADGTPGFGILGAIGAVLSVVFLRRRHTG
ncbi:S8 family serine peptidase [Halopiger goleimassiliensis]|uniref:S8 family serine peptidase n=1 Tax=Halopiger goleimassiliensis TaxID=1293048 RepID=UPI000677E138|nr:S8 family serine peptidase [Halopiger goleimassiliensis]